MSWQTASIAAITDESGVAQIRRHFDIGAFGVHAWTAREACNGHPRAHTAGTTILATGATRCEPYRAAGWEIGAPALPLFAAADYAGAKEILVRGLEEFPESPMMLYNLACADARLGEREPAIEHPAAAAELDVRFKEYARKGEDLDSIRNAPGFPA